MFPHQTPITDGKTTDLKLSNAASELSAAAAPRAREVQASSSSLVLSVLVCPIVTETAKMAAAVKTSPKATILGFSNAI
jgi:hypothetical protein